MVTGLVDKEVGLLASVESPLVESVVLGIRDSVSQDLGKEFGFRERLSRLRTSLEVPSWAREYLLEQIGREQSRGESLLERQLMSPVGKLVEELARGIDETGGGFIGEDFVYAREVVEAWERLVAVKHILENGEDEVIPSGEMKATVEQWETMRAWGVHGRGEMGNYILWQDWVVRVMWQQRGIGIGERQEWVESFLRHVMGKNVKFDNELAQQAAYASAELEIGRDLAGIEQTWRGRQPAEWVWVGGPGDAGRVDGPLLAELKQVGVVSEAAEVVGLDLLAEPGERAGIQVEQGDLRKMAGEHPEWQSKMQLMWLSGSVMTTMDLATASDEYWANLSEIAAEGAVLLIDDAAMEPVTTDNRRVKQGREMQGGGRPMGAVGVNRAYYRDGVDQPTDVGARIITLWERLVMARAYGWRCVNLPEIGSSKWWELVAMINDEEELMRLTSEVQNAAELPFYHAGRKEDGVVGRITMIMEKVKETEGEDGVAVMREIASLMRSE